MAASKRPSYLKRQKEHARMARANAKRQARLERKREGSGAQIGTLEELGISGVMSEPSESLIRQARAQVEDESESESQTPSEGEA